MKTENRFTWREQNGTSIIIIIIIATESDSEFLLLVSINKIQEYQKKSNL